MAKLTKAQRRRKRQQRAEEAAKALRDACTVWTITGLLRHTTVEVDAQVLLSTALTSAPAKYLGFDVQRRSAATRPRMSGDVERVKVPRLLLSRARVALKRHLREGNVKACVDSDGVHLRWHDGRGGLDFVDASTSGGVEQRKLEDCFAVDLRVAGLERAA